MQNHRRRSRSIGEKIVDATEFPKEVALGLPKITVFPRQEATIENHKGIISYDDSFIRVFSTKGVISVCGSELAITAITDTDITIRGNVALVKLDDMEVEA